MHKQEQRIIEALITNLSAAGFLPAMVWTGETYIAASSDKNVSEFDRGSEPERITRALTAAEVLKVFADYDMYAPTLHFTDQHKTTSGPGVMLVEGNGADIISDWHCGNKAFNAIVEQVADAADARVYE